MSYDPLIQEPDLMLEQSRGESTVKFVEGDCSRHEVAISAVVIRSVDFRVCTMVGLDEIDSVDVDSVEGWVVTSSVVDVRLELIVVGIGLDKDDIWEDGIVCVDTASSVKFEMFSWILKLI